ncbi:MAG TPA: ATP-dependent helicase HrpB [Bacteroidota bacterium]|nr:ATP-dependent helicase HrpB [Bacteroidota bacterium]
MPPSAPSFPVDTILPHVASSLQRIPTAVVIAPPGAGKTTRIPLALLEAGLLGNGRLLMLEPRRLAARRAATYISSLLGEQPGQTVGYRIRGESRVSSQTRIEIVTEGILTRMLQESPDLPGVAALVFDEFHERSIHADLGLALALDARDHLQPDLRILIMSATLDGLALNRILGDAPLIRSEGRMYPIETVYRASALEGALEPAVAATILRALSETGGDLLVFLPGRRELQRTRDLLLDATLPEHVRVHLLHGEMAWNDQLAALAPPEPDQRKVILATSIAETSLTIDGVRVVIDGGLARVPRFDPRRGMSGLATVPVSQATADQRRGRAGRQAPGVCYRLWTEDRHQRLDRFPTPEILETDLAPLALDLARWGSPDGSGLRFLDAPPLPHLEQARQLLQQLGALDSSNKLTPHGLAVARLPVHPRLAHMIASAKSVSEADLACDIAAILEGPAMVRGGRKEDCDLEGLLAALHGSGESDRVSRTLILAESKRLRGLLQPPPGEAIEVRSSSPAQSTGLLLALADPDRIAQRRGDGGRRYVLANGTGALLPEWSQLSRHPYLAVGEVDGEGIEARIFLASSLARSTIEQHFSGLIGTKEELGWNDATGSVVKQRVSRLGAITLSGQIMEPSGDEATPILLEGILRRGFSVLPWTRETTGVRNRSEWLRRNGLVDPDWPDLSDERLRATLSTWLGPHVWGMLRLEQLGRIDMNNALRSLLDEKRRRQIEQMAPTHVLTPAGSRIALEYGEGTQPIMAVRLQEMFGQRESPAVAGGRVRVLLHLLSPAGRPLAVTSDLSSFWANAYADVRKQMRGRYPKHPWPEDPRSAAPHSLRRSRR